MTSSLVPRISTIYKDNKMDWWLKDWRKDELNYIAAIYSYQEWNAWHPEIHMPTWLIEFKQSLWHHTTKYPNNKCLERKQPYLPCTSRSKKITTINRIRGLSKDFQKYTLWELEKGNLTNADMATNILVFKSTTWCWLRPWNPRPVIVVCTFGNWSCYWVPNEPERFMKHVVDVNPWSSLFIHFHNCKSLGR